MILQDAFTVEPWNLRETGPGPGPGPAGLAGIDDFAFTGPGPSAPVLAAINRFSTVVLIRPDGSQQTVLTAAAHRPRCARR